MTEKLEPKSWICETEKTLFESKFVSFVERHCRSSEDQREHKFYLLKSGDWCNIIPVTEDGKVVMVRQFRAGIAKHTLEIPGGVVDSDDKDIQSAAIRELAEETGYAMLPHSRCISLGWTYPNPAIQDNRVHCFVVGPVKKTQDQNLDHGEMIDVEEVPIAEVPEKILNHEFAHALMLNTILLLLLKSKSGSDALKNALGDFTHGA